MNTCAPHFFIIITYLQHSQFKMQYYRVHCFVPGLASVPGLCRLAPVWYHRLVGQLPVPVHRLRHIFYSRHLLIIYPSSTVVTYPSSVGLMNYCMNSVVLICADYVTCALLRTLSDRTDIYLIFFTALVVFYCISCTMDTANIFTVLVVIFFNCISCQSFRHSCCSLFRSYFLVVILLFSVGQVIPKFGWVFPFLVPSASWPISTRWRCSTSGGGCSRIFRSFPYILVN